MFSELSIFKCSCCRTIDQKSHDPACPHNTPKGSPERALNAQGEMDGRLARPATSDQPVYLLGYNWGVEATKFLDRYAYEGG